MLKTSLCRQTVPAPSPSLYSPPLSCLKSLVAATIGEEVYVVVRDTSFGFIGPKFKLKLH